MPHDSAETIIFLRQRSRQRGRQNGLTLVPATVFLRRLPASGVISRVLEHIATKFQRLSPYFRGQPFNGTTSVIALRRHPPEIQDGSCKN